MAGVHPEAGALLELFAQNGGAGLRNLALAEARALLVQAAALDVGDPSVRARDIPIRGPGGPLPVRIYTPPGAPGPLPLVAFFHGGGWVLGGLESHDPFCRSLAAAVPAVVVATDYRLAPEHPHPAAVDDALAAVEWAHTRAHEFGADPTRLAVAGDSAGGNLAAVVSLLEHVQGRDRIRFQLLIYPAVDVDHDSESMIDNAEGYLLSRADMDWFHDSYLQGADPTQPSVAPMRAPSLAGLPPALVITAEFDPLRDQGNAYARRLAEAGVDAKSTCYPGMIHGFLTMRGYLSSGRSAFDEAVVALRQALG